MPKIDILCLMTLSSLLILGCARPDTSISPAKEVSQVSESREILTIVAQSARQVVQGLEQLRQANEPLTREFVELYCLYSKRQALSDAQLAQDKDSQIAAIERHRSQIEDLNRQLSDPDGPLFAPLQTTYYLREAEYLLLLAQTGQLESCK